MYYLVAITPSTNLIALYTYTVAGTLILAVTSCAEAIFFIFYGHIYITVIVRSLTVLCCRWFVSAKFDARFHQRIRFVLHCAVPALSLRCPCAVPALSLLCGGLGLDMC